MSAYPPEYRTGALVNALEFLLQGLDLATQCRDGAAVLRAGFLQSLDLCAHFLAGNAEDLGFKNGCNVWRFRILPDSGYTLPNSTPA